MNIRDLMIPDHITTVSDGAFCFCKALRRVRISADSKLSKIGEAAFWGCEQLEEFNFDKNRIDVSTWAFAGCGKLYPQNVKWSAMVML